MTEYVVPTMVVHPALSRDMAASKPGDSPSDRAVPSLRAVQNFRQLQSLESRSAALLVLIFILAALEVCVSIAVILIVALELTNVTSHGEVYVCVLEPNDPYGYVCDLGYGAASAGIALAFSAMLVECMPCNRHHSREVLSIALHTIGCGMWIAALVLILDAHRQANDYYANMNKFGSVDQTPRFAWRGLCWILGAVATAIFGSMALLQGGLLLRRMRLEREAEEGLHTRRSNHRRLADSRQGQILVSYQGWHREAFLAAPLEVEAPNAWQGRSHSKWRESYVPAFSHG